MHQMTTKTGLKNSLFTNKTHFLSFQEKSHKKSYKIIGSFFQFFDCEIIANKRGFIQPLDKDLMW
jgi:hypothetical protein